MKQPDFREIMNMLPEVTTQEREQIIQVTQQYLPAELPRGWTQYTVKYDSMWYGMGIYAHNTGLKVLFDADPLMEPGKVWLHLSVSLKKRMPTYEELKLVKKIFIGPDRQAIQLFPREVKHINIHEYCLHLWCCVEGDGLPDFGRWGTI